MELVSVVISTKNEELNIRNCLTSVSNQSFKNIEIIVVDNDSSDNTREISREFTSKVYTKGPERSAQRNYGAQLASGYYILYLDADMILTPNVIQQCVDQMSANPALIGIYVPELIIGDGFWIKVRRFERSFYTGTVIDAVRFFKRSDFLAIGGFDETLWAGEDWDLDIRLKSIGNTDIIGAALYHNERSFSLGRYIKKKAYYSTSLDAYTAKWGQKHPTIRRQLGFFYRYFGVFFEHGSGMQLVRHPILTVCMYFLRFCVGLVYLTRRKT